MFVSGRDHAATVKTIPDVEARVLRFQAELRLEWRGQDVARAIQAVDHAKATDDHTLMAAHASRWRPA